MIAALVKLGRIDYRRALEIQSRLREARIEDRIPDTLLLLEHPPVYTIGKAGGQGDFKIQVDMLKAETGAEVYTVDRGGRVTFHGPGQLVGYMIFKLRKLNLSVKRLVQLTLEALADACRELGVEAEVSMEKPGVWARGRKLAAIGLSIHGGVTMHGFALNVSVDLEYFRYINPCGLSSSQVTSLSEELGYRVDLWSLADLVANKLGGRLGVCFEEAPLSLLLGY